MTKTRKTLVITGLTLLVAGVLYLALVLLTPTFGTIIGYADEQPPLRIEATGDPEKPLRLARLLFDARPQLREHYWPEPASIEEKTDCWLVRFAAKKPVYRWLGHRQTLRPTAATMSISIDKSDYRARAGNWCQ